MAILNSSGPVEAVEEVMEGLCLSGDEGDRSSSDDEPCSHQQMNNSRFVTADRVACSSLTEKCVVEGLSDGSKKFKVHYLSSITIIIQLFELKGYLGK